jgi:hypothetical protein
LIHLLRRLLAQVTVVQVPLHRQRVQEPVAQVALELSSLNIQAQRSQLLRRRLD